MWSWWNSFESLSKFNNYIQLVIIFLASITALAMLISYKASRQINYLQSKDKLTMQRKLDSLSPRKLMNIDKIVLSNKLISMKGEIITVHYLDDAEPSNFANEIISIMRSSGIYVNANCMIGTGPKPYGIFINPDFPKNIKDILLDAFKAIGEEPQIGPTPTPGQSILIGLKPINTN